VSQVADNKVCAGWVHQREKPRMYCVGRDMNIMDNRVYKLRKVCE